MENKIIKKLEIEMIRKNQVRFHETTDELDASDLSDEEIKDYIRNSVVSSKDTHNIASFIATVKYYENEVAVDEDDYYDVDIYDADNLALTVGWTNLIEYVDEFNGDKATVWHDIYYTKKAAEKNIDKDVKLTIKEFGAERITNVNTCKIEIDAYCHINCYDDNNHCIFSDFFQGYWGN